MVVSDLAAIEIIKMQLAAPFIFLGCLLVVILVLCAIFTPRKSKQYRKILADMFVAGRIKQLAEEKGIDIPEEFESYKRFRKKQQLHLKDLDEAIEEELKEEVGDVEDLDFKETPKGE